MRAIQCFQRQSHTPKELIVAFTSDNVNSRDWLTGLSDPAIKLLEFPSDPNLTLGDKRNLSIEFSSGEYWCTWDDDDWHHPARLEEQITALERSGFRSVGLSNVILYDETSACGYLSASRYAWEQTVMCDRTLMKDNPGLRYASKERGEDSSLLYQLKNQNFLVTLSMPELYIYVYHSANTFGRQHWEVNLLPWSKKLSLEDSLVIKEVLNELSPEHTSASLNEVLKNISRR